MTFTLSPACRRALVGGASAWGSSHLFCEIADTVYSGPKALPQIPRLGPKVLLPSHPQLPYIARLEQDTGTGA